MRWIGEFLDMPIPRERVLATIGVASLVGVVLTWESVPWSWGFTIVCVAMAAVLRAVGRFRQPESWMAYPLLPSVSAPFLSRLFYGRESAWQADIHIVGLFCLSLMVGIWLANQLEIRKLPSRQI